MNGFQGLLTIIDNSIYTGGRLKKKKKTLSSWLKLVKVTLGKWVMDGHQEEDPHFCVHRTY